MRRKRADRIGAHAVRENWEAEQDRLLEHAKGHYARSLKLMHSKDPQLSEDGFHQPRAFDALVEALDHEYEWYRSRAEGGMRDLGTKQARRLLFERGLRAR